MPTPSPTSTQSTKDVPKNSARLAQKLQKKRNQHQQHQTPQRPSSSNEKSTTINAKSSTNLNNNSDATFNKRNNQEFVSNLRTRIQSRTIPRQTQNNNKRYHHHHHPATQAQASVPPKQTNSKTDVLLQPSLEPYVCKLERYELFTTYQAYYLVACDKNSECYRVLRMDRTLIDIVPPPPNKEEAMSPNITSSMNHQHTTNASLIDEYDCSSGSVAMELEEEMYNTDHDRHNRREEKKPTLEGDQTQQVEEDDQPFSKSTYKSLPEFCSEDPHVYTQNEIQEMLDMIHDGNLAHGGLRPVVKAYGIVGFIRFLDCYYLTLITKRTKVGKIGSHGIYSIKSTETFPLKPAETVSSTKDAMNTAGGNDPSSVLLNMWNRGKRSVGLGLTNREIAELRYQGLYQVVDLSKNFFFSYSYDMTRSLQENFLSMTSKLYPPSPFKEMYAWNYFLTRELEECTTAFSSYYWVMPIVHGSYLQRRIYDYGRSLNLILLARRSRHFAGTRYLKRGVSDKGKVANDVEHEQIVHDETIPNVAVESFSSFLQVRGSIPTYWTQESSVTMPKPPIVLNRVDPTYQATQAHFEDLLKRYCSPIVVLDLVKQSEKREREVILGNEFRHAIEFLNSSMDDPHKIRYCALDYSHISKHRSLNVSTSIEEVATWAVNQTGFFSSNPRWKIGPGGMVEVFESASSFVTISQPLGLPIFPMEQQGVLRTNCIDCLDRTNVAQFSAGVEALGQQLVVMGILLRKLDSSSNIVRALIDMYVEIGDHIALQYGGSEAHKKGQGPGSSLSNQPSMGKHKELLTSIRRYYSNTFTDRLKQDAMNLFLGYYIPSRHSVPLWDMESDYYLHVKTDKATHQSIKAYERAFAVHWTDEEEHKNNNGRRALIRHTSTDTNATIDSSFSSTATTTNTIMDRNKRMERIQDRSKAQNVALSLWWRAAIQSYVHQRMWMKLPTTKNTTTSTNTTASHSPFRVLDDPDSSSFDRRYQPSKLTQFDKIFARSWAIPFQSPYTTHQNSSTASQQEDDIINQSGNKNFLTGPFMKTKIDSPIRQQLSDFRDMDDAFSDSSDEEDDNLTLREYVRQYGFQNKATPALQLFVKPFEVEDTCEDGWNYTSFHTKESYDKEHSSHGSSPSLTQESIPFDAGINVSSDHPKKTKGGGGVNTSFSYLGDLTHRNVPCKEYIQYAATSDTTNLSTMTDNTQDFPYFFRSDVRKEFENCLYETNLHSDDVEGIRKLAESAHIGNQIQKGPYSGLHQNDSAIYTQSIIHDQYNTLASLQQRGDDCNIALLELSDTLERNHIHPSSGIKKEILSGLQHFSYKEKTFNEIVHTKASTFGYPRSEITTDDSLKLYCSFFDDQMTNLSNYDMTYIHGQKIPSSSSSGTTKRRNIVASPRTTAFSPVEDTNLSSNYKPWKKEQSQNSNEEKKSMDEVDNYRVPSGFEQINEDLYARKDNKFMVFNRTGVDTWRGSHSFTRIGAILDTLMECSKCP